MVLNSGMFIFSGPFLPWDTFVPQNITPDCSIWQLFVLIILVLFFCHIPVTLALKYRIPDICTYREAIFCGRFEPIGVGPPFLAIEARARLETGTSFPSESWEVPSIPSVTRIKHPSCMASD
ncbi:hypothetical protein B0O99DRAFT_685570 [Bisporella sp. PMI_857]|nr:hypothetical protein B0O99DRAFT_685570 [Bisporella sp. PMI_857]